MPVKALQVEHRVDPDAVRVGAGRRADDHDRAADLLAGERFDLLLAHVLDLEALVAQRRVVDRLRALAEHHEVRVSVGQALIVDDLGVLEAHLPRQLLRGLARGEPVGHGQREAELHDPVAEMVGVGLHALEIDPP